MATADSCGCRSWRRALTALLLTCLAASGLVAGEARAAGATEPATDPASAEIWAGIAAPTDVVYAQGYLLVAYAGGFARIDVDTLEATPVHLDYEDDFVGFRSDGGRAYLVTRHTSYYTNSARLYEIDVVAGTTRHILRHDALGIRTLSPKGGDV